jgi:hypothetical protein
MVEERVESGGKVGFISFHSLKSRRPLVDNFLPKVDMASILMTSDEGWEEESR